MLANVETYHWNEVKEKLIIVIGENLDKMREKGTCNYEIYWSLLKRQTTESILEGALSKSKTTSSPL